MWTASSSKNWGIWNSRRTKKQKAEGVDAAAQNPREDFFKQSGATPQLSKSGAQKASPDRGYSFGFGGLAPTPPPPLDSFLVKCRQERTQEVTSSEMSHFILRTDPFCWAEST